MWPLSTQFLMLWKPDDHLEIPETFKDPDYFRKETFDSVERSTWEASGAEWEAEKRRFLNAIGDTGGSDLSQSFLLRPEQSHIHDSTLGTRSALDSLEMVYADQVIFLILSLLMRFSSTECISVLDKGFLKCHQSDYLRVTFDHF